ncbi:Uncharacterized protein TCM_035685 [Theobroma cacao]|uniref:Putative plant transposon protein domain-containing protein n=1 Tax=Theobroma cacao TaxID=3641 RepID=A0A061FIS5_THECC|nr:Uncharacterized protein TCM_035685 [Theobroma cacao]
MKQMSKVWWYFMASKMLLCLHVSNVTRNRAVFINAIVTKKSINIGQAINHTMMHTAITKRNGLCFPSLIPALCGRADIQWNPSEELLHPNVHIDVGLIYQYSQPSTNGSSSSAPRPQTLQPKAKALISPQRIE